jgi:Fe-S cluster assembly ATPase SufC
VSSFLSVPCRNPGVSVTNFIRTAINETRKANGQEEMPANEMLKVIREKSELLEIDRKFFSFIKRRIFGWRENVMRFFKWQC